jgi:ATP-binding cassette subfamily E protein 1
MMALQPKKSFAVVDYNKCNPKQCNPEKGVCCAVPACTHRVIKQIDGPFEEPMVFQDTCMGCWDCIEACPLEAIEMKHIT